MVTNSFLVLLHFNFRRDPPMAILLWIEESAKYHYKKIKVTISETSKSFRPFLHLKKHSLSQKEYLGPNQKAKKTLT